MWNLIEQAAKQAEQAAKQATENGSGYMSSMREKTKSIIATVQDEAVTILNAMGNTQVTLVDEILYEEEEAYAKFMETFAIDQHTEEISALLEVDEELNEIHSQLVPLTLSYEEFWSRVLFRQSQMKERKDKINSIAQNDAMIQSLENEYEELESSKETETTSNDNEIDKIDDINLLKERLKQAENDLNLLRKKEKISSGKSTFWLAKALELKRQFDEDLSNSTTSHTQQLERLNAEHDKEVTQLRQEIDDARSNGFEAGMQEGQATIDILQEENSLLATQWAKAERNVEDLTQQLLLATANDKDKNTQDSDSMQKEVELWKLRAVKMKKMKEQIENELQQLKNSSSVSAEGNTDQTDSTSETAQSNE